MFTKKRPDNNKQGSNPPGHCGAAKLVITTVIELYRDICCNSRAQGYDAHCTLAAAGT